MNYEESLAYIHSTHNFGSKPGLSRTQALLEKMGNPQNDLIFVHVAGTNGKGSFCAMLSAILQKAGYVVGRYTSPYVYRFNERIAVNGEPIPDEDLSELCTAVRPLADEMDDHPTEFELITSLGMAYFKKKKCDIVVLECGLGGRLDATNVVETSVLSVITGIALDHTAILGDTIEQIAAEKAGILRAGIPCLYGGRDESAARVIEETAKALSSPFFRSAGEKSKITKCDLDGTRFLWREKEYEISLLGLYQVQNAVNVLYAADILRQRGFRISEEAVKSGLKEARWPARYERISDHPLILCDGGHNPEGVTSAAESTRYYFPDRKVLLVTGVMADKDVKVMIGIMKAVTEKAFCLTPDNPRALDADRYAALFEEEGVKAEGFPTPKDALAAAVEEAKRINAPVLCLGSLYQYREIRDAWDEISGKK